jgi:hypothetical protein
METVDYYSNNATITYTNSNGSPYFQDTVPLSAISAACSPPPMEFIYASSLSNQTLQAPTAISTEFVVGNMNNSANDLVNVLGFNVQLNDVIALSFSQFGTVSQIENDTKPMNGGVMISSLNGNDQIFLQGVLPSQLSSRSFHLI